jgi:hypothetical protein
MVAILAQIVLRYDVKTEVEGVRPADFVIGYVPHGTISELDLTSLSADHRGYLTSAPKYSLRGEGRNRFMYLYFIPFLCIVVDLGV